MKKLLDGLTPDDPILNKLEEKEVFRRVPLDYTQVLGFLLSDSDWIRSPVVLRHENFVEVFPGVFLNQRDTWEYYFDKNINELEDDIIPLLVGGNLHITDLNAKAPENEIIDNLKIYNLNIQKEREARSRIYEQKFVYWQLHGGLLLQNEFDWEIDLSWRKQSAIARERNREYDSRHSPKQRAFNEAEDRREKALIKELMRS